MNHQEHYDRAAEVKRFEDSKLGVKGLVDSGLDSIPRFFIHSQDTLSDLRPGRPGPDLIPTIDLSGVDSDRRPDIVEQISLACRELGFYRIVNHGVPVEILDRTIGAVKAFHEQPMEEKARVYRREMETGVSFFSNVDLFQSKAASWRDTLQIRLGPTPAVMEQIPQVCRSEVVEWDRHIRQLGSLLMGLLSQGLGLDAGRLEELTCLGTRVMVGHFYPHCPQPDLTVGIASHTDPGVVTVLLQDQIGGLQVKYEEEWLDVKPVPGALVINVGDIFQIISNDQYKSVEHRVLANPSKDPRVSIAVFCNPSNRENSFGPLPELLSPQNPAQFRQFTFADYMRRFFTKELDGKSLVNYYRV
ncbi:1-aminocyclopropane-1-carboxylate oxidase homolog 4-like [Punica granatum]|uniref:1-aminocyclopropane-1-carboxylate oxidase homolog 4-like n=3 Tax=Punica granatum TaxID=22663 RepID=A0A218WV47_PUNGR|nr:1-aminocyclopropane-1-carboxylate oxidase homolog 4-like [Punica granatum]OWM76675.1 hypothetical protein CDL15_Pgr009240 [Punica granatum]